MRGIADTTLRSVAMVVTDRRWAAIATAMALGFGLFIGVAIGPGASGTLAGAAPQIVEVPASDRGTDEGGGGSATTAAPAPSSSGGAAATEALAPAYSSAAPLETAPLAPIPTEPTPAPQPTGPAPEAPAPEEPEPEPEGQVLAGIVVHANPAAGSYALAIRGGELVAIHSSELPLAGSKLSARVRQLANGTFAEEEKPERDGRAAKASFTGTITFADLDPAAPAYTVSGRGASVLVRVAPDPSGAAPSLPPLGSFATVDVRIGKPPAATSTAVATESATPPPSAPCDLGPGVLPATAPEPPSSALWQQKLKVEDVPPSTYLEVAGLLSGVCLDRPGLLLSADGARDGGEDLLLTLSPKLDAKELRVADSVLATIEVGEDGSLALTGLAGDEHLEGADDAKSAQGDLKR